MHSPRLKALAAELAAGKKGALAAFWEATRREGTPLIEPVEGDADRFWVTFLWRGSPDLRSVHVLKGPAGWGFYDTQLSRLPGTDLWYRTYQVRAGARFGYYFVLDMDYPAWERGITTNQWPKFEVDPFCRSPFPTAERAFIAVAELPGAPEQPWTNVQPEVGLYVAREVIPTPEILDNLLAAGQIPPLVALFVGNVDRAKELPCNDAFAAYITDELVPWAHRTYHVSADPASTIVGGSSYGALAAAYCALRRPDLFGNVLSQSGSYWWYPEYPHHGPAVEPGWLIRAYRDADRTSLRFYLDVGVFERSPDPRYPDQVAVNRHMRDVLLSRGYGVRYAEFNGGHDYACWAGTLGDGIIYLAAHDDDR